MTLTSLTSPVFLLLLLLASCAAPDKVAEEKDAQGKKIEYVYVTPTGSHVPVRVRKDQATTSEKETNDAQNALREMQYRGGRPQQGPGG